MTMQSWSDFHLKLGRLLEGAAFSDIAGLDLTAEGGFERWVATTRVIRRNKRTVYLVGNGASASMASHFAADLAKNGYVHTEVFSDLSLLTAVANDNGYEEVFALPLRRRAVTGDMLVAISSSAPIGAVLGAMTLTLAGSFLSFLRISPDWQIGAQGAILIIVLALRVVINRSEARQTR